MANKRITQLPTAPQVEDNDYLAIDNTSTPTAENEGGTRKILVKDITAKSADAVEYDNTTSGLEADNVQDAIDEVLEEGGKVQDVKVNGVSVLDNNKTAQIVSYKEVTQAQYDALPSSKLTDGIMYCIKDAEFSAEDVPYDNSDSGLESEDVQSAIDEIADVLGALKVEGTVENAQIATFPDGSALPMPKLEIAVEPQQEGSGDPSPSNVRPISGWTEGNVSVCGKNLAKLTYGNKVPSVTTGEMVSVYGWSSDFFKFDKSKEYVVSATTPSRYLLFYDANKTYLGYIVTYASGGYKLNTNQYWDNAVYIKHRSDATSDTTPDIQLEVGSIATTYEPYNGSTITIQLGDTYYGGKLDVVNGVLTVDRVKTVITKDSSIQYRSSGSALTFVSNGYKTVTMGGVNVICDKLKSAYYSNYDSAQNGEIASVSGSTAQTGISFKISDSITSLDELKAWLTDNPLTIVTNLATPITYQLTPTQVSSLLGVNNIFANTGNINKVVYIRDLNIVINNLLNA